MYNIISLICVLLFFFFINSSCVSMYSVDIENNNDKNVREVRSQVFEKNSSLIRDKEVQKIASEAKQRMEGELKLFEVRKSNERAQRDRVGAKKSISILSLDGGGYRGLMEAFLLNRLSVVANRDIHQLFDLVAGTSIGGILSMASVVSGEEPDTAKFKTLDLIDLFVTHKFEIFPQRYWYNYPGRALDAAWSLSGARYSEKPLENLLQNKFGNKTLSNTLADVIVTSKMVIGDTPYLFNSRESKHQNIFMRDIGRVTSAAQTYFPSHLMIYEPGFAPKHFIDGGNWQNNPAELARTESLKLAFENDLNSDQLFMLSLGTGKMPQQYIMSHNAGWLSKSTIVSSLEGIMSANSIGVHLAMIGGFPKGNYKRINPKFCKGIELDDVSEESIAALQDGAESKYEKIEELVKEGFIRQILEEDAKGK